ncbi:ammonium transporter [Tsukamurella soli]|uniref:Ammonium transporter n=2 Tax=Tsukamurella soli TaxID=644556 RepID=A0ABP8K5B3_9ACTN
MTLPMTAFPIMGQPDTGDTAWMLASSALVLLMTPGLAFFYGGMVRSKNVLNMIMMSTVAMGVVTVLWSIYGFSESFGNSEGGLFGSFGQYFGLKGLIQGNASAAVAATKTSPAVAAVNLPVIGTAPDYIPTLVFVAFQLMFAIITVALVSGAIADRLKFGSWVAFTALWATFVYFPVAHWVFAFDGTTGEHGGWIANKLKAIDFAGGTAVHINSGAAGLALALVLGARKGWPKAAMRPHNLPFVMLGSGLLWFGWYGFNAGSALTSGGDAASTFITTTIATGAAMLGWLLVEKLVDGHATSLGAASGVVAGLVAITPSCSSVNVLGALAIGFITSVVCAFAIRLKYKLKYDDALDVVGVHMIGGLMGTLLVGFFLCPQSPAATSGLFANTKGLFYGGGLDQLWRQAVGGFSVMAYSFVATLIIALVIKYTIGLRMSDEEQAEGADETQHAETAYDITSGSGAGSGLSVSTKV